MGTKVPVSFTEPRRLLIVYRSGDIGVEEEGYKINVDTYSLI
jgi:hypothetical protein